MSTEENKALTRRAYEALNQRDLAAFYELLTPDFVLHDASTTIQGLEAYKQWISLYFTAFPDARLTLEEMIAEGHKVVVRQTFRGTHTGELMGIPPTGRQATVTGITINRMANGKIVEDWANFDALGMMQQLGVVPAPGQAS